jgi:hypothetical protein
MAQGGDRVDLQEALRLAWRDAVRRAGVWLKRHGVALPGDELDSGAGAGVLEAAFRQALKRRIGPDIARSATVKIGTAGRSEWYLSLFGIGIWTERFDPAILMGGDGSVSQEGGDDGED